jgi:hypothetical protein
MSDSHNTAIEPAAVEIGEPAAGRALHPFVAAAMRGGALDPGVLRELMQLQREWQADESKRAYTRALIQCKAELPAVIARDRAVSYGQGANATHYTHASLAAAMSALSGPLADHGFSVSWIPAADDRLVRVTCRLTHREGHHEEATLAAPPDTKGSKSMPQSIASTVTLLSRYTLLSLLGVATADMTEPTGEETDRRPPGDTADPARNLRAVDALRRARIELGEVEARIGRRAAEWTTADLDVVREAIREAKERTANTPETPAGREPGEEG